MVIFFTDGYYCDSSYKYSKPNTVLFALEPGGNAKQLFGRVVEIKDKK